MRITALSCVSGYSVNKPKLVTNLFCKRFGTSYCQTHKIYGRAKSKGTFTIEPFVTLVAVPVNNSFTVIQGSSKL